MIDAGMTQITTRVSKDQRFSGESNMHSPHADSI